jgi:alkylation response protein AidB-like acyl-CoA dehydrogenase
MDFNDTPTEATFRNEARAWLENNAAPRLQSQRYARERGSVREYVQRSKEWQRKKAEAGFACIAWPKEFGGRGGTAIQQVIYDQEEAEFDVPPNISLITLGMCVPTVLAVGDDATKKRFASPAIRGEHIWCQLFSEPAAGSDVAGLRTRATQQGDEWIINGQKVWTSGAHYSDYGLLLARSNPELPKHRGLTMFWIDMKAPGIEVRPIHQISGESDFNEVFFTDLRIKDTQRLGEIGAGWQTALITLMNERLAITDTYGPDLTDLISVAKSIPTENGSLLDDAALRERIADWYVATAGLRYTRFRMITALSRGQTPGPEASISKMIAGAKGQEMASAALDLMDQMGIVNDPQTAPLQAIFQRVFMASPGIRIAGGTDEILQNIIAERVLGLPGEVRDDKDKAYKDLPTGK